MIWVPFWKVQGSWKVIPHIGRGEGVFFTVNHFLWHCSFPTMTKTYVKRDNDMSHQIRHICDEWKALICDEACPTLIDLAL
jgi:hypothetical protein